MGLLHLFNCLFVIFEQCSEAQFRKVLWPTIVKCFFHELNKAVCVRDEVLVHKFFCNRLFCIRSSIFSLQERGRFVREI